MLQSTDTINKTTHDTALIYVFSLCMHAAKETEKSTALWVIFHGKADIVPLSR